MTYSVRLLKDMRFKDGSEIIAENLEWAMYNPHKKLEHGTWYWQVKTDIEEWSEPASFVITEKIPEFVTPDAKKLKVPLDNTLNCKLKGFIVFDYNRKILNSTNKCNF